jgi:hypothetical protein
MRMAIGSTIGFVLGGFLGYLLGVEVACGLLDAGNLCGLVGVFITGRSAPLVEALQERC